MQRYFGNLRRSQASPLSLNIASGVALREPSPESGRSSLNRAAGTGPRCPTLLCFTGASAGQPRFAPIRRVPMNNSALGRFIDGGEERSYIRRVRPRFAGAFVQSPNARESATIPE